MSKQTTLPLEILPVGKFKCKGCGSLLLITWGGVYITHNHLKSKLCYDCPVCNKTTFIKYAKYRSQQPKGVIVPIRNKSNTDSSRKTTEGE